MDTFKLLSRSTSLQKSSPSNGISGGKVPSAADSGHLENYVTGKGDNDARIGRGQKRNRPAEDDHVPGPRVSRKLSANSHPSDVAISCKPDTIVEGFSLASHWTEEASEPAVHGDSFDRDEWRTTLKQNRVKVTLLKPKLHNEDDHRKRHERLSQRSQKTADHVKKSHAQLTPRPLQRFSHLSTEYDVSRRIGRNLEAQGYTMPTEVQLGSIPILLGEDYDRGLRMGDKKECHGHHRSGVDLLTVAPTGSGKTLAFLIHLLHGLQQGHRERKKNLGVNTCDGSSQAIILAPTHELVDQIVNEGKKLAIGTGIKVSRMRKGMQLGSSGHISCKEDVSEVLNDGYSDNQPAKTGTVRAHILVSTPMLLLHAVTQFGETTSTPLAGVRYLVLDEADVLLDPLFRTQTLGVWSLCTSAMLQTSLWSATIGASIEDIAQNFILDRRRNLGLSVGRSKHYIIRLVVGVKDSAIPNIAHRLVYAATEQGKLMTVRQMIHPTSTTVSNGPSLQPPFLVFTQTIPRAVALHSELLYEIPPEAGGSSRIAVLHSDLSDCTRSAIMAAFRKGEIWILITTDLLARGIDFRGINGVVNYDIPNTSGIYVHRVGRTGRQGREGGVAVTLYTKEDIKYVKNVANVIAASEKQKAKLPGARREPGLQDWLLKSLPDVSKSVRKDLKEHGVEARRTSAKSKAGYRDARRSRISTKSGFDRALEQKKKQAVTASRGHVLEGDSEGEWNGFGD
ncbi:MAG: hypothetical protein LQ346_004794 [Caloplaca aetnensis]|nr:MAG: hypothetical protein LQ346_004794 [Caloplaca aetnensis]